MANYTEDVKEVVLRNIEHLEHLGGDHIEDVINFLDTVSEEIWEGGEIIGMLASAIRDVADGL